MNSVQEHELLSSPSFHVKTQPIQDFLSKGNHHEKASIFKTREMVHMTFQKTAKKSVHISQALGWLPLIHGGVLVAGTIVSVTAVGLGLLRIIM